MVQPNLPDLEVDALCEQIDQQLQALHLHATEGMQRGEASPPPTALPDPQRRAIETATGAPAAHFWTRFKRAARQDLCHPEGLLYQQWHTWGDLRNKDVVRTFSGVLAGMGIGGQVLPGLIVATAVIVLHLGVNAICDEEKAP
jgi:hypothetical protein